MICGFRSDADCFNSPRGLAENRGAAADDHRDDDCRLIPLHIANYSDFLQPVIAVNAMARFRRATKCTRVYESFDLSNSRAVIDPRTRLRAGSRIVYLIAQTSRRGSRLVLKLAAISASNAHSADDSQFAPTTVAPI
jgi:hypothetical protein